MQGFAQAYLKAPEELQPKQIKVGPTQVLRLLTSAGVDPSSIEFGYATTGADMSGAMAFVESLLAQFLSSQGVEPSIVSGSAQTSTKYTSGVDRLLALIEKFEASKETMALYKRAEQKLWDIVKAWVNLGLRSNLLSQKYVIGLIPEQSTLSIEYKRPESSLSEMEKLEVWKAKREEGLSSRQDWFMDYEGLDIKAANERIGEIDGNEVSRGLYSKREGNQTEVEPERFDGRGDQ